MVELVNALNACSVAHHKGRRGQSCTGNFLCMAEKKRNRLKKGDLVATYHLNTSMVDEELLQFGIVLDCNEWVGDVLVLDNSGGIRWWGNNRWRLLRKRKK